MWWSEYSEGVKEWGEGRDEERKGGRDGMGKEGEGREEEGKGQGRVTISIVEWEACAFEAFLQAHWLYGSSYHSLLY